MKRRTLSSITEYLSPRQIFQLINQPGWEYGIVNRERLQCRDRAFMASLYASAGRVTAVCGGDKISKKNGHLEIVGQYRGLMRGNLEIMDKFLTVKAMSVVKRTAKHGPQDTIRPLFRIPLQRYLYENPYWDQLVPFGWLILEYVERFQPKGRLFPFKRGRAWQIVETTTGMFNHWFRAQAEQFYGTYLLRDSVKLSKFVKVKLRWTVPYVGYDPDAQLKGKERVMDFEWIDQAVEEIKARI